MRNMGSEGGGDVQLLFLAKLAIASLASVSLTFIINYY